MIVKINKKETKIITFYDIPIEDVFFLDNDDETFYIKITSKSAIGFDSGSPMLYDFHKSEKVVQGRIDSIEATKLG